MQCGSRICICPAIPEATVGRMAKELEIVAGESPFIDDPASFAKEGQDIGHRVLERAGGYEGLASSGLPFDRGDANHALVMLCLKVAEAVEAERPAFAERLRAEALKLGTEQARPGTASRQIDMASLFQDLSVTWQILEHPVKSKLKLADDLVGDLSQILMRAETKRIERDLVFLSYSHKDEVWLERLTTMLKPLMRSNTISVWTDKNIKPGERWKTEIKAALARASIAILLVSDHFLASDFIAENELPPLLKQAEENGVRIIWIPISSCLHHHSPISEYQAACDPGRPLEGRSEPEWKSELAKICRDLGSLITSV